MSAVKPQPGDLRPLDAPSPEACGARHENLIAAREALSARHDELERELAAAWSARVDAMALGATSVFLDEGKRDEVAAIVVMRGELAAIRFELADVTHAVELAGNEVRRAGAPHSGEPQQ